MYYFYCNDFLYGEFFLKNKISVNERNYIKNDLPTPDFPQTT